MIEVDIVLHRNQFDLVVKERFSEGITGIYGPSGSGKTSLLHAIAGLERPKQGHIKIGERTLFDAEKGIQIPVEKRKIGYVFQEGRLFPHMSVEQNLRFGYKKKEENKVSFEEVVDLLKLESLLTSKPSQISGGERQRTALGRSLLSAPDVLLLDEPFSAVDVQLRKQILPFILSIQKKVGVPMLVVSHDLPDLLKLSNTLFLMQNGSSIGHGEYYELLTQTAASEFLGTNTLLNVIDMQVLGTRAEEDLTVCAQQPGSQEVCIKSIGDATAYQVGQAVKIFIHADDIALSKTQLVDTSIQNQLEGKVTDLIQREASQLCIVDVGFPLIVEITSESRKRLNIEVGTKLWCLFKSVAIEVL